MKHITVFLATALLSTCFATSAMAQMLPPPGGGLGGGGTAGGGSLGGGGLGGGSGLGVCSGAQGVPDGYCSTSDGSQSNGVACEESSQCTSQLYNHCITAPSLTGFWSPGTITQAGTNANVGDFCYYNSGTSNNPQGAQCVDQQTGAGCCVAGSSC